MEKITKEVAIRAKDVILKYLRGCEYNYQETKVVVTQQTPILEQYVKESKKIKERQFVYVENIASKKPRENCICFDGIYYGILIQDEEGNRYDSVFDVKDKLGDKAFVMGHDNRVWDYAYFEELDLVVGRVNFASYIDSEHKIERSGEYYTFFTRDNFSHFSKEHATLSDTLVFESDRSSESLMKAVKEMYGLDTGIVNISGNKYIPLDSISNIKTWLNSATNSEKKNGPAQKKIDNLVSTYELSNVQFEEKTEIFSSKAIVEKLNDNLCVARWIYKYKDDIIDGMRLYVDDKGVYACKRNNHGEYIRLNHKLLSPVHFQSSDTKLSIGDLSGTKLQYTKEILNNVHDECKIQVMVMCLIDEKIEQLFKIGFGPSVTPYFVENAKQSFSKTIKSIINTDEANHNFHKWIGLNAYQTKRIVEIQKQEGIYSDNYPGTYGGCSLPTRRNAFTLIKILKHLLTGLDQCSISHIDNETFDNMLNSVALSMWKANENDDYSFGYLKACAIYSFLDENYNDEKKNVLNAWIKYLPHLYNFSEDMRQKHANYQAYRDYLYMLSTMASRDGFKLFPKTMDELKSLHDMLSLLYRLKTTKRQKEDFENNLIKVKELEYSPENAKFLVKIPTKIEDLVVEGSELHHCVASYVPKIAKGETNIVFLRKQDEPEKPFFTIEVDNEHIVQQVHGFGNCNTYVVDGLLDFVKDWAKKKQLTIENIEKVR